MEILIGVNLAILLIFVIGTASARLADFVYKNGLESLVIGSIEIKKQPFIAIAFYLQTQIAGALLIWLAN
jgi:hypothetical protein